MVGTFQPLVENQKIVDENGKPTQYFIRFIQQKQEDIGTAVSEAEAEAIAIAEIATWAAARDVTAGTGLDGGGNLSADITIDLADTAVTPGTYGDATNVPQITVDQQGRITDVVDVAITGGGGGGGNVYSAQPVTIPVLASFTGANLGTSSSSNVTNGILFQLPATDAGTVRGYKETTYPTPPFTRYLRFQSDIQSDSAITAAAYFAHGFFLRNSTSGRLLTMGPQVQRISGDEQVLYSNIIERRSIYATVSATPVFRHTVAENMNLWLRVDVTSTGVSFYVSRDGKSTWRLVGTETFSTYVTATGGSVDECGWFCFASLNNTHDAVLYNYGSTAP